MKKVLLVSGLSICFFIVKGQDSILLKSGKSITGQIFSFENNIVRIKIGQDTSVYKLEEIKSLKYNGPSTKLNMSPVPVKDKVRRKEIEASPVKIEE